MANNSYSYKFGVLYCKAGQTVEEQMFSNKTGSADWEEFLDVIGERVNIQVYKKEEKEKRKRKEMEIQLTV